MNVLAAYVAVLLALGAYAGFEHFRAERLSIRLDERNAQIDTEIARRRLEVSEWVVEASRRGEKAESALKATRVVRQRITTEIVEEVPVYVTSLADSRSWVTTGWVRIHDAAARGEALPVGPPELVDSASGVKPSVAAEVVAQNYGECREWRSQVIGWQSWYSTELKNWGK